MQIKQEQINQCEIDLQIEIEVEKVKSAVDETYKDLAKVTNIPGFRKGKAPRAILERFLDEEKVKDRVADRLMQPAYKEALEEMKIEPFAPADVEMIKFELNEPMVFKAKVPLPPKVELGQYKDLEIERKVLPVTDEDVDGEIQHMLERQAQYNQIFDRSVIDGDTVLLEMKEDSNPEEEMKKQVVQVGSNLPDFDKGIIGMNPDEEKVIEVTYPDDYDSEELKGKSVQIRVKIIEIHERILPELTDEWVKERFYHEPEEGEEPSEDSIDTVEKLKARMRSSMEKAAEDVADSNVHEEIIKKIVEGSDVCFPDVMVEERVHERLDELNEELKKRQVNFEQYLKRTGQTYEQIHDNYAEDARKGIKTMLALGEVVEKENLKVADEDVETEMKTMSEDRGVPIETIRAYVDKTDSLQSIRNRILQKKVLDFLMQASNIKNVG